MGTSGVYERYFEKDGKLYHHIFDTRTGFPVDNGLLSLTIVTDRSFDADGCTTMLFALGRRRGMELGKKLGLDVIAADDQKRVYVSIGVSKYFEITNQGYKLSERFGGGAVSLLPEPVYEEGLGSARHADSPRDVPGELLARGDLDEPGDSLRHGARRRRIGRGLGPEGRG